MSKRKPVEVYMCLTDYHYELGNASGGNVVYASIKDIKHHMECVGECGIVKVKVVYDKVAQKENRKMGSALPLAGLESNPVYLNHLRRRIKLYEEGILRCELKIAQGMDRR